MCLFIGKYLFIITDSYAGISRSASVVIAYLMQELEMSLFDALTHTRKRRSIIFPNPGFQRQLMEYERKIKASRLKKEIKFI
jgi:protein-tyrosine phosphatase